jgi:hypothetical protein
VKHRLIATATAAVLLASGMAACSSGASTPAKTPAASVAASVPASAPAATPTTPPVTPKPAPTASSQPMLAAPICAPADHFCITFTVPGNPKPDIYDTDVKTTAGKRPGHYYGIPVDHNQDVTVYKPKSSSPWKALEADHNWKWPNHKHTSFKGHRAILASTTAEHQAKDNPFRDVSLKVWYKGKIYSMKIVAPQGLKQAEAYFDNLVLK